MTLPKLRRSQLETLQLTAAGYRIGEIADRYGVCRATVDGSLATMRERFGVDTNAALVGRALALGILDPAQMLADQKARQRAQRKAA